MENTLNGKKVLKFSISRLLREQNENKSSLFFQDRYDKSKKQSHATVPLIIVNTDIHIH